MFNLPIEQIHKFILRQPFGIPPEEGWPHSDHHTQPGCGQLDIHLSSAHIIVVMAAVCRLQEVATIET